VTVYKTGQHLPTSGDAMMIYFLFYRLEDRRLPSAVVFKITRFN
jgi:hypothetical protein